MRILTLAFTLFLAAGAHGADEGDLLRYRDSTERMSLNITQGIEVPSVEGKIAGRDISLDLSLSNGGEAEVRVAIDKAKASYTAHDMVQRLSARHLAGRSFSLSVVVGGRHIAQADPSEAPVLSLDAMVAGGFSVSSMLTDAFPVLPESPVAVGDTWTSERSVRSLEGWVWGIGTMVHRHEVTAVDQRDGHTIVTVQTRGETSLDSLEGQRAYSGDVKRTLRWVFDATDGRLVSLSMDQESDGTCELPQGETRIHQTTRVELTPIDPGAS